MSFATTALKSRPERRRGARVQASSAALVAVLVGLASGGAAAAESAAPAEGEHPLAPLLRMAEDGVDALERDVHDYTCTIIKRERRDGRLKPYEFMDAKIRHANAAEGTPFSVYLRFKAPDNVAGRELLYLKGRNAGKMLVRRGGRRMSYMTTYLDPESPIALAENRYPITQIGFKSLVELLIGVIKEDMQHGECVVQYFKNAKIGDTDCTRIVVEHPHRRDHFRYHRAVVFIDEQRNLPIAYASYLWPETPGGKPVLVEEYIHANIRLNVGLTDSDFDKANPNYGFMQPEQAIVKD